MYRLIHSLFLALTLFLIPAGSSGYAGTSSGHPVVPGFERFYTSEKANLGNAGRLLVTELGCVNCHQTPDTSLSHRQGPILDKVGDRVKASWLSKYLANPRAVKPGTTMPDLLAGDPDREAKAKALAHFLASTGAVEHERIQTKNIGAGRDLYNRVGCIACHGSRKLNGDPDQVLSSSIPLGELKTKYTLATLARFLADPVHIRQSGRMPQLLNPKEANEVASFLLQGIKSPLVGKGTTLYTYYEGDWDKLPDFSKLKPRDKGKASGFDLSVARRGNNFALKFDGVIQVPGDGQYMFTLSCDDGGRVYIDDKEVVDNDGIHPTTTKTGKVSLTKGIHKISVVYFQGGGEAVLNVFIQGPGLGRRPIGDLVAATEADLKKKPVAVKPEDGFEIQKDLVAKGKELFGSLGCASCHQMKQGGKTVGVALKATPLEKLTAGKGCLSDTPVKGTPWYALSDAQKKALAAAPKAKAPARTPETIISETMTTFNCYACHVRNKMGGPLDDINKLFLTTQPEMGDEGRLPPPIDGVGAKIRPDYLRKLLDKGIHDRPYMHTRMPGFGNANVGHLVDIFGNTDKIAATPEVKFSEPLSRVKGQARHLIGALALGCIKCHTFAGQKAEGVQGIDMTIMPQKLKRDWFHYYVTEPQKVRPGTRMPTAFPDGMSTLPKILDGKATTQIEAMWVYLQDGKNARLPVGSTQNAIPLVPIGNAIIYRNFIQGAGSRGIAVGYPEKVHLAFDANEVRMAMLWQGAFIDAGRHWTGRGVGYEGPMGDNIMNLPAGSSFAILAGNADWPRGSAKEQGYRFKGYRLNPQDRPTFLYEMNGIRIEETPNPLVSGKDIGMTRAFSIATDKPLNNLTYRAAVADKIEDLKDGWFKIDGTWKMRIKDAKAEIRKSGGKTELIVPLSFKDGTAKFEQTYVW